MSASHIAHQPHFSKDHRGGGLSDATNTFDPQHRAMKFPVENANGDFSQVLFAADECVCPGSRDFVRVFWIHLPVVGRVGIRATMCVAAPNGNVQRSRGRTTSSDTFSFQADPPVYCTFARYGCSVHVGAVPASPFGLFSMLECCC